MNWKKPPFITCLCACSTLLLLWMATPTQAWTNTPTRPAPQPPMLIQPGTTSAPNLNGGYTYRLPNGQHVESKPNLNGGYDYRLPDGRNVECRPNLNGGQDCR